MQSTKRTIAAEIERLAEVTGAPASFVRRVRSLFCNKGISLDADAAPYRPALERAFSKERAIRRRAEETRAKLVKLQRQLSEFSAVFHYQLNRLRALQASLDQRFPDRRRPSTRVQSTEARSPARRSRGSHSHGLLVPGPKEPQ